MIEMVLLPEFEEGKEKWTISLVVLGFYLSFFITDPSSLLSDKTFGFILKWLPMRRSRLKLVHQNYEEYCRQLFVFYQINRWKDCLKQEGKMIDIGNAKPKRLRCTKLGASSFRAPKEAPAAITEDGNKELMIMIFM